MICSFTKPNLSWEHYKISYRDHDLVMSDIQKEDLLKRVFRVNNDGIRGSSPVKDALIHVFTEELRHRDEMIAIPWQMDVEPLDMGWLSVMKNSSSLGYEIGRLEQEI
jgi:uncharacterized damage-inducible protein DinB